MAGEAMVPRAQVKKSSPWTWIAGIGGLGLAGVMLVIVLLVIWAGKARDNRNATQTALALVVPPGDTATVPPTDRPEFTEVPGDIPTVALPSETPVPLVPTETSTPTPSLEPFVVEPYCSMFKQSPVYVQQFQPVILQWRWDALTSELVQDHIQAAIYEIYLDGKRINAEKMSDIQYLSDKKYYRVYWSATVGVLSPGKHRAERYLSWTQKISDGWNTFGPGGKIETESDYCDIIVR